VLLVHKERTEYFPTTVVEFYAPAGVITRWKATPSFSQMIGLLGAAGWELVSTQIAGGDSGSIGPRLSERVVPDYPDTAYSFDRCDMIAFLKRPVEPGRRIDNSFPPG
jgi:hypothetical protein